MRYVKVALLAGNGEPMREVTVSEHNAKADVLIWGNRVFIKENATDLTFKEANAASVVPVFGLDENGHGPGSAGDVRRGH